MDGESPSVQVVRGLHEAFNRRDRDGFLGRLADDVIWNVAGAHPLAGDFRGPARLWEAHLEPLWPSPARVEERSVLEHGAHVVALVEWLHDFGEGERAWSGVEVFRVEDGRVAARAEFTSRQSELDALFVRGCAAADISAA